MLVHSYMILSMKDYGLLVFATTLAVVLGGCPPGYTPYYDGRCFIMSNDAATFTDAIVGCDERNGHLVSIHNSVDNERLKIVTAEESQLSFYIGLRCNIQTAKYEWTDGSPMNYANFQNAPKTCLDAPNVLYSPIDGKWHAYKDGGTNHYLCEYIHDDEYPCAQRFTFIKYGETCVIPQPVGSTWGDAEQTCVSTYQDSHLLSIHSPEENAAIQQLAKQQGFSAGIHIGLKIVDSSRPVWNDGSDVDYTNYSPGMPIIQFGAATAMRAETGQWLSVHEQGLDMLQSFCAVPAQDPNVTISAPECPESPYMFVDGDDKIDLYSPGFPMYIPTGTQCDYYLASADESDRILLEFSTFELNACCDAVEIFDGVLSTEPIATITGIPAAGYQVKTTESNIMHVQLTAADGVGIRGFHGQFSIAS